MSVDDAKKYLSRMEKERERREPLNKRAYADARDLSAWVSVYEFGSAEFSKKAGKVIKNM